MQILPSHAAQNSTNWKCPGEPIGTAYRTISVIQRDSKVYVLIPSKGEHEGFKRIQLGRSWQSNIPACNALHGTRVVLHYSTIRKLSQGTATN